VHKAAFCHLKRCTQGMVPASHEIHILFCSWKDTKDCGLWQRAQEDPSERRTNAWHRVGVLTKDAVCVVCVCV
jgi:hypothetical protein